MFAHALGFDSIVFHAISVLFRRRSDRLDLEQLGVADRDCSAYRLGHSTRQTSLQRRMCIERENSSTSGIELLDAYDE